jgi:hypothetical protein
VGQCSRGHAGGALADAVGGHEHLEWMIFTSSTSRGRTGSCPERWKPEGCNVSVASAQPVGVCPLGGVWPQSARTDWPSSSAGCVR